MRRRQRVYVIVSVVAMAAGVFLLGSRAVVEWSHWQAHSAMTQRSFEKAVEHLLRAEKAAPNDADTQFRLARCHRMLGNFAEMMRCLKQARSGGFDAERLRREQLMAFAQTGDMRRVTPWLPELLSNPGEDGSEICEAVVSGYFVTWQISKAMSIIDAWKRDYPEDAQPHVSLARYYVQSGNLPGAVEAFETALELQPMRVKVRAELATILQQLHRYVESKSQYLQCLEIIPDDAEFLSGYASCLLETGDSDAARAYANRALAASPELIPALYLVGKLDLSMGDSEAALPRLEQAFKAMPYSPEIRYNYASALRNTGRMEEAQRHFDGLEKQQQEQSALRGLLSQLRLSPERTDIRYQIGAILLEYGNPIEGTAWLKSIFLSDPNHSEAHQALASYYERVGQSELAEGHRKYTLTVLDPD
jgi:tetratricopeptide (TPR) repeat protein